MTAPLPATGTPPAPRWRDVLEIGAAPIQGRAVISVASNNVLVSDRVRPVLDHLLARNPSTGPESTLVALREVVPISDAAALYRRLQDLRATEGRAGTFWRNWLRGWVVVPLWRPSRRFAEALRGRVLTPALLTGWATLCLLALLSLGLQPLPRLLALSPWEWALLWALMTATTALHELGHVSVAAHHGVRARAVGIGLLYLQPAGFADVSGAWLVPRKQRITIALGGMLFQSVPVLLGYGLWRLTAEPLAGWYVTFNLTWMAFNLLPFVRLDGYWVLSFALDEYNLRQRSVTQLLRLLRIASGPPPWRGNQAVLWTIFGALSLAFTGGLYASAAAWAQSMAPARVSPFLPLAGIPIGLATAGVAFLRRRRRRGRQEARA